MPIPARNRWHKTMALAVIFNGDALPAEFRIFTAGLNVTTNAEQPFVFDAKAAAAVMAEYRAHGVDVMIDLEHLSLEQESNAYDPDARGWCKLELRQSPAGPELWAVDVTWTPDGEARLRDKRQRYISPFFAFAKDSRQIMAIHNVAIVAMPAIDHIEPLVAASQTNGGGVAMSPEQFAQIAEALGLGADANVEDVLATVAAMVKKIQDAANGTPAAGDPAAAAGDAPKEGEPAPMVAAKRLSIASRTIARLADKADIGAAITEIEAWRTSHLVLEKQRAALSEERATLEGGERRRLVGELVKLSAETPATAWAPDGAGVPDGKTPVKRLADEPIAELRARVAKLSAVNGRRDSPRPPAGTETHGLSARELAMCSEKKIDPEKYAATRAGIKARNASNVQGA
jgi:phage I-like protein